MPTFRNTLSVPTSQAPPFISSFAAEIITPYLLSYSSITTSTAELPIQSSNTPVLPCSGKGYITTNEDLITHLENSSYLLAYEDRTDRVFRNVGI
jgi:hypothetical protein